MRKREARFALGMLVAAAMAAACSAALDHPTPQDAQWASNEWPGTTVEDLAHGRALYVDKCSGCHNLHLPAEHAPGEWKGFVAYMVAEAKLTPEEQAEIVRYLAAASARSRGLEPSAGTDNAEVDSGGR
jgi:mono/diheme cytochrome c family protein